MIRLAISVEGDTEEEFVKHLLANHLRERGIEPTPILLGRARGRSRGGDVSPERLESEMAHLRHAFDAVTSLVDFYGFRRRGDRTVDELEEHLRRKLGHPRHPQRVFPYVQRHEFEGLLFSDVDAFTKIIGVSPTSIQTLREIRSKFPTPEDINDNKETAPSKRIKKVIPRYNKKVDGPRLAMEMGLAAIRAECPRFNNWVTSLESLANED